MTDVRTKQRIKNDDLTHISIRIRKDQHARLSAEQYARNLKLADVVRDNLDLAFAMKHELSKIVEGGYDDDDPSSSPRLVHSLLFRVEERILAGLDNLSGNILQQFARLAGHSSNGVNQEETNNVESTVENFISLIADTEEHPREVWIGAFLEIVPRLKLVGRQQLDELETNGEAWLRERESS